MVLQRIHAGYSHSTLRKWHERSAIKPSDIVYPMFISDQIDKLEEIENFPNQYSVGLNRLIDNFSPLYSLGLRAVLLFGSFRDPKGLKNAKDNRGSIADNSPVIEAIRILKHSFPGLLIIADVCLCAYTDHGHCGVLAQDGTIDNDLSVQRISEVATRFAEAGADVIAPSDMMDGRVSAIQRALEAKGIRNRVAIMSYSSKFASSLYGPFRNACDSSVRKTQHISDRKTYQIPPCAGDLALKASLRDENEGADFLIVKPGMFYLDIVQRLATSATVPVAIYQVSGEYMMLFKAAEGGVVNLNDVVMESLMSMKRAGASILITYFAPLVLKHLAKEMESFLDTKK